MNKLRAMIGTVCLVFLALSACYWMTAGGAGEVQLDLSAFAAQGAGDQYARIWLVANNGLYRLGKDRDYVDILIRDFGEIRLTLENIPVGPVYRVWLSFVIEQPEGWFLTDYWAESAPFEVAAGQETTVAFSQQSLQGSPFWMVWDVAGKKLKGVVVDDGGTIVTADGSTVYWGSDPFSTFSPSAAPAGYTINSLSRGINVYSPSSLEAWLNTNSGIVPFVDLSFDTNFSTALGAVSVLGSAGHEDDLLGSSIFFYRDGGLGGTSVPSNPPSPDTWRWINLGSDSVYDCLVASPGDGYFATSGGAFRLPKAFLQDASPSISGYKDPFSAPARILSLGLIDQYGDGDVLFMGTTDGVWSVQMNAGTFQGSPQREPGTEGHSIRKISVSPFSPDFRAYLSSTDLFIWDGVTLSRYPLCSVLPGRITGMDWYPSFASADEYLLISGDGGLVYILVPSPAV